LAGTDTRVTDISRQVRKNRWNEDESPLDILHKLTLEIHNVRDMAIVVRMEPKQRERGNNQEYGVLFTSMPLHEILGLLDLGKQDVTYRAFNVENDEGPSG
jgi:hypothetical protein